MGSLERRIFECSSCTDKGKKCPVAQRFKTNTGEEAVPEAYLGKPESGFMMVGINPGSDENYIQGQEFDGYLSWIRDYWLGGYDKRLWRIYGEVAEVFGYSLEKDEVVVTNLVHCPTKSWSKRDDIAWWLDKSEKQKAIDLCSDYCFDLISEYNSKVIFVHGFDVVRAFSKHYNWGIKEQDVNSKFLQGKVITTNNNQHFVLSRHLASFQFSKNHEYWNRIREAADLF